MFVTPDGGLTGAGYALFIAIGVAALIGASFLAGKVSKKRKLTTKQLVFCAAAIALAFVTSYVQLVKMPYGGTVTLMSMLFIVLIGYWYGVWAGALTGLAYGILQFLQDPYYLSLLQICLDYLFAFAALGTAGFLRKQKNGLVKGYIAAVIGRGVFASLAGYVFWMEYMPENFPASLKAVYPIVYNFMYLIVEAVLTLIVISLPPVKSALNRVKGFALDERSRV